MPSGPPASRRQATGRRADQAADADRRGAEPIARAAATSSESSLLGEQTSPNAGETPAVRRAWVRTASPVRCGQAACRSRPLGAATARRAFTLVEMLVALMILSVVGTAMIGTLLAATQIFERGERQKAATDELMAVWSLVEADLGRAIPPQEGGVLYATPHPLGDPTAAAGGLHEIGWTIANPDPEDAIADPYEFVLYRVDGTAVDAQNRRTYPLLRELYESRGSMIASDPTVSTSTITTGCLAFAVQLAGTNTDRPGEVLAVPADAWWTRMRVTTPSGGGGTVPSEPLVGEPPYDTTASWTAARSFRYPDAIRLVISLDPARLPQRGVVVRDDGANAIQIAGIPDWPSSPGRILRVGDELIGFHGARGGTLMVNGAIDDGPLGPNDDGRGVYGSTPPSGGHPRGEEARLGITTAITRTLPR